jgi:hypothetical protein
LPFIFCFGLWHLCSPYLAEATRLWDFAVACLVLRLRCFDGIGGAKG